MKPKETWALRGPFFYSSLVMRSFICAALLSASLAPTAAVAQRVDQGFKNGRCADSGASVLLFHLVVVAQFQADVQAEKYSCWNEGSSEVALCGVAGRFDDRLGK